MAKPKTPKEIPVELVDLDSMTKREKLGFGKNTGVSLADMFFERDEDGGLPKDTPVFELEMEMLFISVKRIKGCENMDWETFLDSDYVTETTETTEAAAPKGHEK